MHWFYVREQKLREIIGKFGFSFSLWKKKENNTIKIQIYFWLIRMLSLFETCVYMNIRQMFIRQKRILALGSAKYVGIHIIHIYIRMSVAWNRFRSILIIFRVSDVHVLWFCGCASRTTHTHTHTRSLLYTRIYYIMYIIVFIAVLPSAEPPPPTPKLNYTLFRKFIFICTKMHECEIRCFG